MGLYCFWRMMHVWQILDFHAALDRLLTYWIRIGSGRRCFGQIFGVRSWIFWGPKLDFQGVKVGFTIFFQRLTARTWSLRGCCHWLVWVERLNSLKNEISAGECNLKVGYNWLFGGLNNIPIATHPFYLILATYLEFKAHSQEFQPNCFLLLIQKLSYSIDIY